MLLAKPKQGLTLRDPRTRTIVPPDGVLVPEHDPFWRQLEFMGDVELVEPPETETPPQPAASDAKTETVSDLPLPPPATAEPHA